MDEKEIIKLVKEIEENLRLLKHDK